MIEALNGPETNAEGGGPVMYSDEVRCAAHVNVATTEGISGSGPCPTIMTFRDIILNEMKAQGLNYCEVARRAGFDNGNMWRFVNGKKNMKFSLRTALKLMRALDIPHERLAEVKL